MAYFLPTLVHLTRLLDLRATCAPTTMRSKGTAMKRQLRMVLYDSSYLAGYFSAGAVARANHRM
jgi:hypothetical protein